MLTSTVPCSLRSFNTRLIAVDRVNKQQQHEPQQNKNHQMPLGCLSSPPSFHDSPRLCSFARNISTTTTTTSFTACDERESVARMSLSYKHIVLYYNYSDRLRGWVCSPCLPVLRTVGDSCLYFSG